MNAHCQGEVLSYDSEFIIKKHMRLIDSKPFRNVFTQELGGSSSKSKEKKNIFNNKKEIQGNKGERSCQINPTYIFRVLCIKDNDNQ